MTTTVVHYELAGNVAVLTLANAPVNALSHAVREQLIAGIHRAREDDSVAAVVITSSLPLFSAGADISEFAHAPKSPSLPEVLDVIEQSHKPVTAILPGGAFGGGLELALACHYRVSVDGNKVGLPEVHLGILPGAGGTQ